MLLIFKQFSLGRPNCADVRSVEIRRSASVKVENPTVFQLLYRPSDRCHIPKFHEPDGREYGEPTVRLDADPPPP